MRFAVSTFKFGLPWDSNSIYNDLTRRPPKSFDGLLARIDEFSRVEDDDRAINRSSFKRDRGNDRKDEGNDKKNRREDIYEGKKSSGEAFKGVNTIFVKPIHKIMFEIQDKPFFKWPRQMGGHPSKRDTNQRCSYHKDYGHRTKNCKTLKQFLEKLIEQGHLANYVKKQRE